MASNGDHKRDDFESVERRSSDAHTVGFHVTREVHVGVHELLTPRKWRRPASFISQRRTDE